MDLRQFVVLVAVMFAILAVMPACADSDSGLSNAPDATFSEIACLDLNGDNVLSAGDAADPSRLPDINGDGAIDSGDAAHFEGLEIPLDPNRDRDACDDEDAPEYLVAAGGSVATAADCAAGPHVLVVAIGGGVVNLKREDDAAGVRGTADALLGEFERRGVQALAVVSGPIVPGALNPHSAMETWLARDAALRLRGAECLRAVLIGHSHGAVTAAVVAQRLEQEFPGRITAVVVIDRVEALYTGDTTSRPTTAPVFNIFETNDDMRGAPRDAANVENWDASGERAPERGEDGGELQLVTHTTIDNSASVRERIVAEVLERSQDLIVPR